MPSSSKTTWLTDANGNRCSVKYWGTKEAAQAALDSLKNCRDCSRCSGYSGLKNAQPIEAGAVAKGPPPVPVIEDIHRRVYKAASAPGSLDMTREALDMTTWHTCEKTHCRGGRVIALAGPTGRELERFHNTELAAMLIYDASAPGFRINPARFYDGNAAALADMKRLAEAS